MVQPIGPTNSINTNSKMDTNVIRTAVKDAFLTYGCPDPTEHNEYMRVFYTEGKKNPCVARMMLPGIIRKSAIEESDSFQKIFSQEVQPEIDALREIPVYTLSDYGKKRDTINSGNAIRAKADAATFLKALHAENNEMGDRLQADVVQLRDEFNNEFKRLYPKTWRIRDRLISDWGVASDRPTAPKRPLYQKLQIAAPEGGYESIYPNTLETRVRLLANGRLGKKGKMSPLKKMLWNNPIAKTLDIAKGVKKVCTSLIKTL